MEFAGKVAYVTGGGSGIGAAVARRLSNRGAEAVVVADLNAAAAGAVAAGLPAGHAATVDVADAARVEESIEAVVRDHGRLDVVVHAAGVDDPAAKQVIADALLAGEPPQVTGMAARTPEPLRHSLADGRVRPYASPEEIADVALFLAGDGAANLVGAVLLANGGRFTV